LVRACRNSDATVLVTGARLPRRARYAPLVFDNLATGIGASHKRAHPKRLNRIDSPQRKEELAR
jgi:hypothetical protein